MSPPLFVEFVDHLGHYDRLGLALVGHDRQDFLLHVLDGWGITQAVLEVVEPGEGLHLAANVIVLQYCVVARVPNFESLLFHALVQDFKLSICLLNQNFALRFLQILLDPFALRVKLLENLL